MTQWAMLGWRRRTSSLPCGQLGYRREDEHLPILLPSDKVGHRLSAHWARQRATPVGVPLRFWLERQEMDGNVAWTWRDCLYWQRSGQEEDHGSVVLIFKEATGPWSKGVHSHPLCYPKPRMFR
jgi:hypothetical protein